MYPPNIMSTAFVCMFCCVANAETWGWVDLCDSVCFRNMRELTNLYEYGTADAPDQKVVDYFTKNPDPGHAFETTKTLAYIAAKKDKEKDKKN
jgi:hypothetical protein